MHSGGNPMMYCNYEAIPSCDGFDGCTQGNSGAILCCLMSDLYHQGGRTRSKCHMTSITLLTCHSAITSGGAWLGTVLASTQYSGSVVGKVWHVRQLRTIAR